MRRFRRLDEADDSLRPLSCEGRLLTGRAVNRPRMASVLSRYRCCSAARRSGALMARRSSALRRHPPSSCSDSKARLARWNRNRSRSLETSHGASRCEHRLSAHVSSRVNRGLETSRPPSSTCFGGPTCERYATGVDAAGCARLFEKGWRWIGWAAAGWRGGGGNGSGFGRGGGCGRFGRARAVRCAGAARGRL